MHSVFTFKKRGMHQANLVFINYIILDLFSEFHDTDLAPPNYMLWRGGYFN